MEGKHYVYILYSESRDLFYKGYTQDIKRRLERHQEGHSRYTHDKGPWTLVFIQSYRSKTEALIRERQLKRQNHRYLKWLILSEKNELLRVDACHLG